MQKSTSVSKILPVLFGFFIMGFCDVVGITSTHVKADFGLSDTLSNMIPVVLFAMFFLFSVPTGILMNKIGRKKTVLLSNIITAVALFIPLLDYSFITALCAFALLGIANTILQVSLNPLLSNVVQGDKLTSSLTAGQFVKAISSFSAPFVAAFAANQIGHWQFMFPVFAVVTILSTVWLFATRIEEETDKAETSSFRDVLGLLKDKVIFLLFLGILFVVGVDVGINTAAPKILIERCGLDVNSAGYGSSVYFAFRTAGAFIGAFLLARVAASSFFRINILIAVAALVSLLFVQEKFLLFALYGVVGFTVANIFPIIYSYAIQRRPEKANEISGLMITGVFGGAVIPFFMGITSDAIKSQVGSVIIILISALYLTYCAFALAKNENK
jgi:MFS transporter, FHS family, L-fucose permease